MNLTIEQASYLTIGIAFLIVLALVALIVWDMRSIK